MEVDITDKGRDYLDKIKQGTITVPDGEGYSVFDYTILRVLVADGPQDIEKTISEVKLDHGSNTGEFMKTSFRGLFEAGYIETV